MFELHVFIGMASVGRMICGKNHPSLIRVLDERTQLPGQCTRVLKNPELSSL